MKPFEVRAENATLGITLAEVRKFVEDTKELDGGSYIDCRVPDDTADPPKILPAACFGLEVC